MSTLEREAVRGLEVLAGLVRFVLGEADNCLQAGTAIGQWPTSTKDGLKMLLQSSWLLKKSFKGANLFRISLV